jgi:hypothetical protein
MHFIPTLLAAIGLCAGITDALRHQNRYRDLEQDLQRFQERRSLSGANSTGEQIVAEYVELPLDHFGNAGTFRNRYWVSTANYKPGGPVFLYDVGEQDIGNSAVPELTANTAFSKLVKNFSGIGIVWEHRYYGKSTPFNITNTTTPEQMQYLTTEQALTDVAAFAWQFSRPSLPNVTLTPAGAPWVFVGGSYPGMRAAFMRQHFPGTIFASWSSSAPVQASVDMSFYFEPIWQGLNANGWGNCTADVRAAVTAMDNIMANDTTSAALKIQFLGKGADQNSNAYFADALASIFGEWQSYGSAGLLTSFCNYIANDTATGKLSPAEGWAPTKGSQYVIDKWSTWKPFARFVNTQMNVDCVGPASAPINSTNPTDCNLQKIATDPSQISWMWQYCTEWGFLQSANVGEHQLVSKYNSLTHQKEVCHKQFPTGTASGLLPEWPNVQATNAKFGGWNIRPSNTYWVGSQYDPWRTLSPLSDMPFSNNVHADSAIPKCVALGDKTQSEYLFSALVPNGEHCWDFHTESQLGQPARDLFVSALKEWLSCYAPGAPNEYVKKIAAKKQ